MATVDFRYDNAREDLNVRDPRLKRALLHSPEKCATLNEYAALTGMETGEVVEALGPYFDTGAMSLELHGDEVFIHTGPLGRLPGSPTINVPPNLWEQLRARFDVPSAHALWRLSREMERAGWAVEHRLPRMLSELGPLRTPPRLGVVTGPHVISALVLGEPFNDDVALLDLYRRADAPAVALICDLGDLDSVVTRVRRWTLTHPESTTSALVLEAPQYNPVLLRTVDGSITPVAITRDILGGYFW